MINNLEYRFALLLVSVLVVLIISSGTGAAVGDTEVRIEENTTEKDTQAYDIIVSNASNGVRGFEFNISISDNSSGEIVGVSPVVGSEKRGNIFEYDINPDRSSTTVAGIYFSQSSIISGESGRIMTVEIDDLRDIESIETNLHKDANEIGISDKDGNRYTIYYLSDIVRLYDANNNSEINIIELGTAAKDYASGEISIVELGEVARTYAN